MNHYDCKYLLAFLLAFAYISGGSARDLPDVPAAMERDTVRLAPDSTAMPAMLPSVIADVDAVDVGKEVMKVKPPRVNIYDMPYSVTANYPNGKMLGINTGVLFVAGVATLGVLQMLPEGATAWNKKEISEIPFWKRWERNVRHGPVWDEDNFMFNYVLHPYGGAVYYMAARSQGLNLFWSFLYSAGVSTLFWEYGVEAFMEIPSIQDLIVTPVAGVILGEGFYLLKRHIVANGYKLFGSGAVGNVVAYLIDPVNEVVGIFAGNPNRKKHRVAEKSLSCTPWMGSTRGGRVTGFAVSLTF